MLAIFTFSIKALVLVALVSTSLWLIFPSFSGMQRYVKDFLSERANQALLLSFVQNPVALLIASDRDIEKKRFAEAELKLELAIGLLEMHGATKSRMQAYNDKLTALKDLPKSTGAKDK